MLYHFLSLICDAGFIKSSKPEYAEKTMNSVRSALSSKFAVLLMLLLPIMWAASIAMPVVNAPTQNYPEFIITGKLIAAFGLFGIFINQFAWFSNITFWILFIMFMRDSQSHKAGAVVIVLHCFFLINLLWWDSWAADEGGVTSHTIESYLVGFYIWLIGMILMGLIVSLKIFSDYKLNSEESSHP